MPIIPLNYSISVLLAAVMVLTLLPAQAAYAEETDTAVVETVEAQQTAQDTADASQDETAPTADAPQDELQALGETENKLLSDGEIFATDRKTITSYTRVLLVGEETDAITAPAGAKDGYTWTAGTGTGVVSISSKTGQSIIIDALAPGYTIVAAGYTDDNNIACTYMVPVNVIGLSNGKEGDSALTYKGQDGETASYEGSLQILNQMEPGTGQTTATYLGSVSYTKKGATDTSYFGKETLTIEGFQSGATTAQEVAPLNLQAITPGESFNVEAGNSVKAMTANGTYTLSYSITSQDESETSHTETRKLAIKEKITNHYLTFMPSINGYVLNGANGSPMYDGDGITYEANYLSIPKGSTKAFAFSAVNTTEESANVTLSYEVDEYNKDYLTIEPSDGILGSMAENTISVTGTAATVSYTDGTTNGTARIKVTAKETIDDSEYEWVVGQQYLYVKVTETGIVPADTYKTVVFKQGTVDVNGVIQNATISITNPGNVDLVWAQDEGSEDILAVDSTTSNSSLALDIYEGGLVNLTAYAKTDTEKANPLASIVIRALKPAATHKTIDYTTTGKSDIALSIQAGYRGGSDPLDRSATGDKDRNELLEGVKDGAYTSFNDAHVYRFHNFKMPTDSPLSETYADTNIQLNKLNTSTAVDITGDNGYYRKNYGYYGIYKDSEDTDSNYWLNLTGTGAQTYENTVAYETDTITLDIGEGGAGTVSWERANDSAPTDIYTTVVEGTTTTPITPTSGSFTYAIDKNVFEIVGSADGNSVKINAKQPGTQTLRATYSYKTPEDKKATETIDIVVTVTDAENLDSELTAALSADSKGTVTSTNSQPFLVEPGGSLDLVEYVALNSKVVSGATWDWGNATITGSVSGLLPATNSLITRTSTGGVNTFTVSDKANEMFTIAVGVSYTVSDYSGDWKTIKKTVNAYIKAEQPLGNEKIYIQKRTDASSSFTDAPKDHYYFTTLDGHDDLGGNVINISFFDGSDQYTTGLVNSTSSNPHKLDIVSDDPTIAVAELVAGTGTKIVVTPKSVGQTTLRLYRSGSSEPIENGFLVVTVLGVAGDGVPLAYDSTTKKYSATMTAVGSFKQEMVLGAYPTVGSDGFDLGAVNSIVTEWTSTSTSVVSVDGTDKVTATAEGTGSSNMSVKYTIKIPVMTGGVSAMESYTIASSQQATIKVTADSVSFGTPQTGSKYSTKSTALSFNANDVWYLYPELSDPSDKVASVTYDVFSDAVCTVSATGLEIVSEEPGYQMVNKRKVYGGQLVATKIGNYYVKVKALDESGNKLAEDIIGPVSVDVTAFTVTDNNGTAVACVSGNTSYIGALTNLAVVYDGSDWENVNTAAAAKNRKVTGYTKTPTLRNVIASYADFNAFYRFPKGWDWESGNDALSFYEGDQAGYLDRTVIYRNVNGDKVYAATGTGYQTSTVRVYLANLGKLEFTGLSDTEKKDGIVRPYGDGGDVYLNRNVDFVPLGKGSSTGTNIDIDDYISELLEDGISAELVKVVSSKANVATAGYNAGKGSIWISTGEVTGTTAIKVTEFGSEASVTVKTAASINSIVSEFDTTAASGKNLTAIVAKGVYVGDYYTDLENPALTAANNLITLKATVTSVDSATIITAESSDKSVAIIKKAEMTKAAEPTTIGGDTYVYTAEVEVLNAGDTTISVKANDTYKTTETITLHVIQNAPTVGNVIIDNNTTTKSGKVNVSWTADNSVLEGYQVNTKGNPTLTDASGFFEAKFDANENLIIAEKAAAAEAGVESGEYPVTLVIPVTTASTLGVASGNDAALSVTSITKEITVGVTSRILTGDDFVGKQTNTYNVFYRTTWGDEYTYGGAQGYAFVKFENNNAEISDIQLTSSYYEIIEKSASDAYAVVRLKEGITDLKAAIKGANKKVVFSVTPAGYSTGRDVPVTLTVINKAPAYKLSSKAGTVYDMSEDFDHTVETTLSSTMTGEDINGVEVDYQVKGASYKSTYTISENPEQGIVKITVPSGAKTTSGKLVLTNGTNWQVATTPISLSYKINVSTKNPALALSKNTITLNRSVNAATEGYEADVVTVTLAGGGEIHSELGLGFTGANAKSTAVLGEAGDNKGLDIADEGDNTYSIALSDSPASKGSYKIRFFITYGGKQIKKDLTVKVVETALNKAVKVKKTGKIDVINGDSIVVTPTLSAVTGTITNIYKNIGKDSFERGEEGDPFVATLNSDKTISIRRNGDYSFATNANYTVNLVLELENSLRNGTGKETLIELAPIKFKVTQAKLKAVAVPKVITVNPEASGTTGYATIVLYAGNEEGWISNDQLPEFVSATKGLTVDLTDAEITNEGAGYTFKYKIAGTDTVKPGKTVTAKFKVYAGNGATNLKSKSATVTVKIKVNKTAVTPAK